MPNTLRFTTGENLDPQSISVLLDIYRDRIITNYTTNVCPFTRKVCVPENAEEFTVNPSGGVIHISQFDSQCVICVITGLPTWIDSAIRIYGNNGLESAIVSEEGFHIYRKRTRLGCCTGCGHYFELPNSFYLESLRRCVMCASNMRPDFPFRSWNVMEAMLEPNPGKFLETPLPIGVELEVQYTDPALAMKAVKKIPSFVGIGSDSSISGGKGLELRLPPLVGKYAEDVVKKVCDILVQNKFTVDSSCGMHIHLGVTDHPIFRSLNPNQKTLAMKNIWVMYLLFEDVIRSFLPPSRRGNRYCKSMQFSFTLDEIMRASSTDQLEMLWYSAKNKLEVARHKDEYRHETRYYGINLHTLFREGHAEIRYHTGTLNPRKILEWANLHTSIVDACIKMAKEGFDVFTTDEVSRLRGGLEESTVELFNLIELPESTRGYFYARQSLFSPKPPKVGKEHLDSGMDELKKEEEK